MTQKVNKKQIIGEKIREHLARNQTWLALQAGISEAQLSRKMNGTKDWTQDELDRINKVLGTDFKI
jgi:plasmid maintenance system antidote protein VapI